MSIFIVSFYYFFWFGKSSSGQLIHKRSVIPERQHQEARRCDCRIGSHLRRDKHQRKHARAKKHYMQPLCQLLVKFWWKEHWTKVSRRVAGTLAKQFIVLFYMNLSKPLSFSRPQILSLWKEVLNWKEFWCSAKGPSTGVQQNWDWVRALLLATMWLLASYINSLNLSCTIGRYRTELFI